MKIGIAFGSGAARGWSHFGVIRELHKAGIEPQVIAGSSIGALVGAALASDQINELAAWVSEFSRKDGLRLLDADFAAGMLKGQKVMQEIADVIEDRNIEDLDRTFIAVATELQTGREVWIDKGPMLKAARASCGMPGILSPVQLNNKWLVDGGLVNPVPVSACYAHGADAVIAVNLNRRLMEYPAPIAKGTGPKDPGPISDASPENYLSSVANIFDSWFSTKSTKANDPGFFEVLYSSINVMQDRITRARLAADPPFVELCPRTGAISFWEFHRHEEMIAAGEKAVTERMPRVDELASLVAATDSDLI